MPWWHFLLESQSEHMWCNMQSNVGNIRKKITTSYFIWLTTVGRQSQFVLKDQHVFSQDVYWSLPSNPSGFPLLKFRFMLLIKKMKPLHKHTSMHVAAFLQQPHLTQVQQKYIGCVIVVVECQVLCVCAIEPGAVCSKCRTGTQRQ